MASKRRKGYERGKYPAYDNEFDNRRLESRILDRDIVPNLHTVIEDRQNLQGLLFERVGDEKGNYIRSGELRRAYLPAIKGKLADLETKFKRVQEQLVKSGYEKLTSMPVELLNEKYELEAEMDVTLEEIEVLENKIIVFTEAEKNADDDQVLAYGLRCNGHFWGTRAPNYEMINQLHDLDGQLIKMHEDGFLIIDDVRSPYNGMKVSDYHKFLF